MKLSFVLIAFALLSRADQLVFKNVTVIDVQAGRAQADMTVIVSDGRISAVAKSPRAKVPQGARTIDARGKFLIPGLWDMHVHLAGPFDSTVAQGWSVPLIAANGITGVRSMFDNMALIRGLRADIAAGKVVGPRIIASGPIVDGPNPIWPGSISVATPQEGRTAVHDVKAMGADFVKVYELLPRDAYFAILEEAQREGMVVAGHVPKSVSAADVSNAG